MFMTKCRSLWVLLMMPLITSITTKFRTRNFSWRILLLASTGNWHSWRQYYLFYSFFHLQSILWPFWMIFACISTAWIWNQKNNFPLCVCSSNRPCSTIRSLTCCYQHHVPKPVVCLGGHFRTHPKEISIITFWLKTI